MTTPLDNCACLWQVALHHPEEFRTMVERLRGQGVVKLGPLEIAATKPNTEPAKPLTEAQMRERAHELAQRRMDTALAASSVRIAVPKPALNGRSRNVVPNGAQRGGDTSE